MTISMVSAVAQEMAQILAHKNTVLKAIWHAEARAH